MAEKVDSGDESEQHSGGDDYSDHGGSLSWHPGDYHLYGGQMLDYGWPAYSGYFQPYCDTMYHTRFYSGHQKNPIDVQCSSESRAKVHVQESLKPQQITHTVKLINKARKKEYRIEKLGSTPFNSLESIKAALKDRGGNVNDGIGYIEPGHGLNGKQKWLLDDDDVSEMYTAHRKSREVMLYAYNNVPGGGESGESSVTRGKRPKLKPLKETPPPKRGSTSTITQVEAIIADLKERHGSKYDAAKYACWAHCIQNGKHSSVDEPPDLPFFTGRKKSGSTSQCDTTSSGSPTKRLSLRTECINQLSKWHSLLQGGAISQDQYDEMKDTIMEDMKSMK